VYSDDSDIQPREGDGIVRHRLLQQHPDGNEIPGLSRHDQEGHRYNNSEDSSNVQKAEQSARLLQQQLAPPDPEPIELLAELTHDAIIAVMSAVDVNGLPRNANQDLEVEQQVSSVIVAVRNLLYVSCALSGSLPNTINERSSDPNASAVAQQLQAQLKNSQRKVTATLSKLVLSARAVRYRRELMSGDLLIRVEQDARDLQRAVDSFVAEVQKQYSRTEIQQLHERVGRKRLRAVFGLSHLGLGIPGAGVAGSWKGFGFINYDEGVGLPRRSLCEETLLEVQSLADTLADKLQNYCSAYSQDNATAGMLLDPSAYSFTHRQRRCGPRWISGCTRQRDVIP
jgi:son of sevenless-like protein